MSEYMSVPLRSFFLPKGTVVVGTSRGHLKRDIKGAGYQRGEISKCPRV